MHKTQRNLNKKQVPDKLFQQALTFLGSREYGQAAAELKKVLLLCPNNSQVLYYLGISLYYQGDQPQGMAKIKQALRIQPAYEEARYNLGVMLEEQGLLNEAIEQYRLVAGENLHNFQAQFALANSLAKAGLEVEAEAVYRQVIAVKPDFSLCYNNLANLLKKRGNSAEAALLYQQAVQLDASQYQAFYNLGHIYKEMGMWQEAANCLQNVINIKPDFAEAYTNLGVITEILGNYDAAELYYRKALQVNCSLVDAMNNLGHVLSKKGEPDDADNMLGPGENYLTKAIELQPEYGDAHWNLALSLLRRGEYIEGFKEYEWGFRTKPPIRKRLTDTVRWDGTGFAGKTLLVYGEQGHGDEIQFVRYLPLVKKMGGKVIYCCKKPLQRLLTMSSLGADEIIELSAVRARQEDMAVPLMSLPHIMKTNLETIPAAIPYIQADENEVAWWQARLKKYDGLKIGLAWQGSNEHKENALRSCRLTDFLPLADIPKVTFVSLQKSQGKEEIQNVANKFNIVDFTDELDDFADTAALIANLDLIISIDTAVVHLAGAMGKPVWVLLSKSADWRWLTKSSDTPWYPGMRLFRQAELGRWNTVLKVIAENLRNMS